MKKTWFMLFALSLTCCLLLAGCKEEKHAAEETKQTVSLDTTYALVDVYDKLELTASVYDSEGQPVEAQISWSSSDPAVAEVSEGVVIARSKGQAQITACLETGETAVCQITTENNGLIPRLEVQGVSNGSLTIARGQSYHLSRKVSFGGADSTDADTTYTFRVTDPAVATVSADGVLQAVGQGSTQVIVTATWRGMGGEDMQGGEDAYALQVLIDLTVTQS